MLSLQRLLAFSPQGSLAAMINDLNPGLSLNSDDVIFGQPVALGPTLTQISMTMRRLYAAGDFVPYTGEITFTYNRLDITDFCQLAFVDFNPTLPCTTQTLLDLLNDLFGNAFPSADFVIEPITASNAGNYTLKTQPTSLRWVGTYTTSLTNSPTVYIVGTPPTMYPFQSYTFAFQGVGGITPYTWSANGLPPGIVINSATGVLSGTCTQAGTYVVTIILQDKQLTQAQLGVVFTVNLPVGDVPMAFMNSYPAGVIGVPYQHDVTITGGLTPYGVPSVVEGTLPPGLSLSVVNGDLLRLSGTPTAMYYGLVKIMVPSSDLLNGTFYQELIVIPPLSVNGNFYPGEVGLAYVDGLAITGGSGDYFNPELLNGTTLPPGIDSLFIYDNMIMIRGTPTAGGNYPLDIQFQSGYDLSLIVNLSVNIRIPLTGKLF